MDAVANAKNQYLDLLPSSQRMKSPENYNPKSPRSNSNDGSKYQDNYTSKNENEEYFEMNDQLKKKISERLFNQDYEDEDEEN